MDALQNSTDLCKQLNAATQLLKAALPILLAITAYAERIVSFMTIPPIFWGFFEISSLFKITLWWEKAQKRFLL
ncbi:hypothetical protein [Entomobacter blattae]|uniref:hypothetical protein n=1 Tax=Entomobacter blattae TaxID=2762277 RepID=UPI00193B29A2|nr:hypothetical protein [Entomobacter blattae]